MKGVRNFLVMVIVIGALIVVGTPLYNAYEEHEKQKHEEEYVTYFVGWQDAHPSQGTILINNKATPITGWYRDNRDGAYTVDVPFHYGEHYLISVYFSAVSSVDEGAHGTVDIFWKGHRMPITDCPKTRTTLGDVTCSGVALPAPKFK